MGGRSSSRLSRSVTEYLRRSSRSATEQLRGSSQSVSESSYGCIKKVAVGLSLITNTTVRSREGKPVLVYVY